MCISIEELGFIIVCTMFKFLFLIFFLYRAIPSAVFSQPPIGQVGLSEEQVINIMSQYLQLLEVAFLLKCMLFLQATEQYGDVDIYTSNFKPMKATLSGLPDRVFMKLIVCAKTNKILGLHMCGDDSPEIVQVNAIVLYLLFQSKQKSNF